MRVLSPDEAIELAMGLEERAACQSNERIKAKLLAKARAAVRNILAEHPNHSNLHHVLGLCWYDETEWTNEAKEQIEHHFSTAARLDESNQFAALFLAHFYFDTARYDEALKLFRQIDESYFERLEQKYRVLKNHELILCCRLYLNADGVSVEEIEELCREYESTEPIDVPLPQELAVCLAQLAANSPKLKHTAERFILLLKRINFLEAKSIADSLKTIRRLLVD